MRYLFMETAEPKPVPQIPSTEPIPEITPTGTTTDQQPTISTPIKPPIVQKVSTKTKSKILTVLIILFVFVILGSLGYWAYQNYFASPKQITEKLTPTQVPTINPIDDWKTFNNTKYNFNFKYPQLWTLREVSSPGLDDQIWLAISSDSLTGTYGEIGTDARAPISFIISQKNLSLDYKESQFNNFISVPYLAGNLEGVKITGINKESLNQETIISAKMGSWYVNIIPIETEEMKYLNQILSTFKFTNDNDTSNWKTYTNTKYGFEFKYPLSLSVNKTQTNDSTIQLEGQSDTSLRIMINPTGFSIGTPNKEFTGTYTEGKGILITDIKENDPTEFRNFTDKKVVYIFHDLKVNSNQIDIIYQYGSSDNKPKEKEDTLFNQILSTFKFID